MGCFSLTAVFSRPWVGRCIDRWGRIWFLRGAPFLIAATALGLLAAHALVAVVALRLVQGLAGAAFYTGAATVATDLAPEERRAEYISRFSLFLYAGFAAGPALGEALIESRGYAWAWGAAASAALAAGIVAATLTETAPTHAGGGNGDDDHERRSNGTRRRWIHPAAIGPGVVLLTIAVGYTAISSFAPLYARSIGMSSSGGLYVTFALTILAVRLVSGRLADRFGRAAVALPGLVSAAAGMLLLAVVAVPIAAYVGVAAFGAGHALIFPALMALTVDRVSERERGEALGSFTACFDLGAAGGGYIVGFVADHAGYTAAWTTPALLCVLGIVWLLAVVRPSERNEGALPTVTPEPAGT